MSFPFGVVSSQVISGPPPSGTTIDFIGGSYVVDGVTVTAADVVDHPELITANGLELIEDGDVVNILGDLLALLLTANWTIVLEWNHLSATGQLYPLVLTGAGGDNVVQIRRLGSSSHYLFVEDFGGAGYRGVADNFAFGNGIHKIALTRTNTKLVFSADGRAVATGDIDNFALSPTAAGFGGYPGWTISPTMFIRSLQILDPVSDAELPTLSA
ncbi:MAG: hypothetical protein E5Y34_06550 [Mesorhizobium sp.]|uniref:hypothetical protein n=1 Tax=Mesorhizobium sp. TaxID=1871066 RepID=UPI0011F62EBE|nr:hypothetical protein [Mesorhizobium sp.]TIN02684.1 MAG: hypothetical protein E5Y34_06550 [Mesorhizobium sp.]